ncbi:hypothetical protein ACFFWC_15540, partial [Plantactinospora siamensis]
MTRPTLADLAAAGVRLDAAAIATVADDLARLLAARHETGRPHGAIGARTVCLTDDGTAVPVDPARADDLISPRAGYPADRRGWADLLRTLLDRSGTTDVAGAFLQGCAAIGERDLTAARRALAAGAPVMGVRLPDRAALVAALDAYRGTGPDPTASTVALRAGDGSTDAGPTVALRG